MIWGIWEIVFFFCLKKSNEKEKINQIELYYIMKREAKSNTIYEWAEEEEAAAKTKIVRKLNKFIWQLLSFVFVENSNEKEIYRNVE